MNALLEWGKVFIVDLDKALFLQFSFDKSEMGEESANLIPLLYPRPPAASVLQRSEKCVAVVCW